MRNTTRRLAGAALTACVLLIGACSNQSDDAKPSDDTPVRSATANQLTNTATHSPSAAPTGAQVPKPTRQGALNVSIDVVHAIDEAYRTFDVAHLRRISAEPCETCKEIIHEFPRRHAQGYTVDGGRLSVCGNAHIIGGTPADQQILLEVPVQASKLVTRDRHGRVFNAPDDFLGSGPAATGFTITEAVWISHTWKVLSLAFQTPEPGDSLSPIYSCRRQATAQE